MALPLPSSPHWAPISTTAGIGSWFSSSIVGHRSAPGGPDDGRVSACRAVQLDLRRLAPGQAPRRGDVAACRGTPSPSSSAGRCPALAAVLDGAAQGRAAAARSRWPGSRPRTAASTGLARDLGHRQRRASASSPWSATTTAGCCCAAGRIEAAGDGRAVAEPPPRRCRPTTTTSRSPTAPVTRIDVRPDWTAVDTIGVTVMTLPLRPMQRTSGRALQIASRPGPHRPGRRARSPRR